MRVPVRGHPGQSQRGPSGLADAVILRSRRAAWWRNIVSCCARQSPADPVRRALLFCVVLDRQRSRLEDFFSADTDFFGRVACVQNHP